MSDPRPQRVLFVVIAERGHIHPMIGVMQALQAAGHDVGVYCHKHPATWLGDAGVEVPMWSAPPEPPRRAARTSVVRADDVRWLSRFIELRSQDVFGPPITESLDAAIAEFRPDVFCVDPIAYHGIAAAQQRGAPWVGISTNLISVAPAAFTCPMVEAYRLFAPRLVQLLAEHGIDLPVKVNEVISPWLHTVFATEAFAPRSAPDDVALRAGRARHVPPRAPAPFPWDRLDPARPLIYTSFGGGDALAFPVDALRAIFAALSADEAQFVVPLHHLIDDPFVAELPDHVIAVRFAPQVELIERAAAVITHGGAGSVMECLTKGRPMLVLPIGHEQPLQGLLVEQAGAGSTLPLAGLTSDAVRARLLPLLRDDAPERTRAAQLAAGYRADGSARIAELVIEIARTRAPYRA